MQALDANTYTSAGTLADTAVIKVDNETRALLEIVQSEQDQGMTWGLALDEALALYEESAQRYDTDGYDASLPF
jgi:predicted secreted protein